ncbi:tetratricopeptide repeat protein [Leptospira fainei serovar Hurstbridge str. BUT 6]|uniref:Tetratricopeptide repeat protein n=1 Tax=Leptospira fainei serovar Hurstbridge str. BUT 6 TaxID=1193011 RepID=S3W6R5_9LEPT|nr:tetratricopeptide repeat protein [Leptospira fainei]EPG75847.1 tetratricopeptide repeat protein [Leptospira fainei serovar Hurstbridge str. BUT 6]
MNLKSSYFAVLILYIALPTWLRADLPLPFPEDRSGMEESESPLTSTGEPLKSLEGVTGEASVSAPEVNTETSKSAETVIGNDSNLKSAEEDSVALQTSPAKPKSTQLPNLNGKKTRKAKKKDDQDPSQAAYERGLLRLRNGEKNAAQEEFTKAAGSQGEASGKAKLELSKLADTQTNSTSPESQDEEMKWKTLLESARSLRSQGKNSEAQTALLQVATEAPPEYRAQALLQLGDSLFRQGRFADSRAYLIDFWNRFGRKYPISADPNSAEFRRQLEERDLGAYLLFKSSYKAGEAEWARKFLIKYLEKSSDDSKGRFAPLRAELENLSKRDL